MCINTQAFGITACTMQTIGTLFRLIDKSNKLGKGKTYKNRLSRSRITQ